MRVIFSATARTDLRDIDDAVSDDDPAAAKRLMARVQSACLGLAEIPNRFQRVEGTPLRCRPIGNNLIFYDVSERVEIIRILHGARDWSSILDED